MTGEIAVSGCAPAPPSPEGQPDPEMKPVPEPRVAPEIPRGSELTWAHAGAVIFAVVLVVATATTAATFAVYGFDNVTGFGAPRAFVPGEIEGLLAARLALFLLTFQFVVVVLGLSIGKIAGSWGRSAAAHDRAPPTFGRPHAEPRAARLVSMAMPAGGARVIIASTGVLMAMAVSYGLAIYAIDPLAVAQDVGPFADLMKSETWWLVAIAAIIGAPIAEELLFRGVLFNALKASPLGAGVAAVVSAAMWAALHVNYSIYGLLAIFLIGLYLAWVRATTGTLLAPMVCHGVYNASIFLLLMSVPDGAFAT